METEAGDGGGDHDREREVNRANAGVHTGAMRITATMKCGRVTTTAGGQEIARLRAVAKGSGGAVATVIDIRLTNPQIHWLILPGPRAAREIRNPKSEI